MTLLEWRKANNFTQIKLAKILRVGSHASIQRYESGARVPRPEIMKRIVKVTKGKVTANDFF